MKLLVDGVFYQLAGSGIARVWRSILPSVAAADEIEVIMLDRGAAPLIEGVRRVPFPSHKFSFSYESSRQIQLACDHYGADVFTSTYYTSPLRTPSFALVYDMIPERLGFDLSARDWKEKEVSLLHARMHVCISESTRKDLVDIYPGVDSSCTRVAYCGVNRINFRPRSATEVEKFRKALGLTREFFLLVGSRVQHMGYKNGRLFFESLSRTDADFDVLCVGGEPEGESYARESLPGDVVVRRVELSDELLAVAYSSATALIYPSLYEGFGMPVLEAMACGCPVVTTRASSLPEVGGDAVLYVNGYSHQEMADALAHVRTLAVRKDLSAAGLARAATFNWNDMANRVSECAREVFSRSAEWSRFYMEWSELRKRQGAVDVL